MQQLLIETVVMSEISTGHHSPIPPAGKSSHRANALPSLSAIGLTFLFSGPQESSSTRFVVKSSLTGLTL
ncbi:hypothetical protein ACSQOT_005112, partial [Klebsiella michiganensis]